MNLIYIKTLKLKKIALLLVAACAVLVLGLSPVFPSHQEVPVTSWAVANRIVVIDPGHGGIDPGAVGYKGSAEKDIVLQVAKQLRSVMTQAGAKVLMTRETDIDLGTPGSGSLLSRKREDLSKRVALANKNGADVYISIHVNAFPSARWRGAQIFYQRGQIESKKLAEAIQSELIRIMGNTTRAAKPEDFFTTRKTKMPAVIVEIGFISNPAEAKLLADPSYQRKLSYAIYSGISKYYVEKTTKK